MFRTIRFWLDSVVPEAVLRFAFWLQRPVRASDLVHLAFTPLYVLIAIQVWPIAVFFGFTVIVHVYEQLFPRAWS